MIRGLVSFFIFLLSTSFCQAQQDSSYTDTVIVVQPPLVIRQQVHLSVPVYSKKPTSLDIGAYYSIHKNLAPSSEVQADIFHSYGLQLRYHEGKVELGVGAGLLSTQMTYQVPQQRTEQRTVTETVLDTIDCFTIITPGKIEVGCVTQPRDTVLQRMVHTNYTTENRAQVNYLQIPISLGYTFVKQKWHLTPSFQLIYNKKLGRAIDHLPLKDKLWMAEGQLSIGYAFTSHLQAEAKVSYQTNLSSIYSKDDIQGDWTLLGLGVGLFWRF